MGSNFGRVLGSAAPSFSRMAMAVAESQQRQAEAERQREFEITKLHIADRLASDVAARRDEQQRAGTRERALLASGVPLNAGDDVQQFLESGRIDKYDTGGLPGPTMPAPAWAEPKNLSRIGQRIAAEMSVLGGAAKSADDYFKGQKQEFETSLARAVAEGQLLPDAQGRGMALLKATPLFKVPEGFTGNQFTGEIDMTAPVNGGRQQYVQAQTGAQRANAVQSYAAADNSRAGAGLHRLQAQQLLGTMGADGNGAQMPRMQSARTLGVPLADVDPYAGLTPKSADQARKTAAAALDKQFAARTDEVQAELSMARDAERFKALNETTSTGGLNALPGAGVVRGAVDDKFAELRAISNRIVPKMREPGSGATSDFDARMFQSATIGPDKPAAANRAIADAMIARAQLAADKLDFDRGYADLNGHLRGADRAWKQYANDNPIFDPVAQSQGRLALNRNRQSYQDYFRRRMGATDATQPPGAAGPNQAPRGNAGRPPLDSFRR